jgi:hypothetical protein
VAKVEWPMGAVAVSPPSASRNFRTQHYSGSRPSREKAHGLTRLLFAAKFLSSYGYHPRLEQRGHRVTKCIH